MLTSVKLIHSLGNTKKTPKLGKSYVIFGRGEIVLSFEDRLLIFLPLCILPKWGQAA